MILLTVAVDWESALFSARDGVDVLAIGVGLVDAAASVAARLARRPYDLVINAGIAGAFEGAASVGDGVVVAEESIEMDWETGAPIALPGGATLVQTTHSDPVLVAQLSGRGFPALRGITVSRITATEATAARLAARGAQVESMEGFAVLRAAQRAGVRAIEVRGISNRVGERERSNWNFEAGREGARRVTAALFDVLESAVREPV